MRPTKAIVIVLIISSGLAVFASGVMSDQSTTTGPLTLQYPKSVSSIPILAMIDEYPDDYSGSFFTDHPQALAQLITGEIDVLATGFSVGYSRYQSSGDLVHLMTPVWGASAVMSSREVKDIAEFSGGVVYAPFEGSPIDIYLKATLELAGLADKISIQYAPFPQAAALITQGKAEAAVLVEPLASKLELAGKAYRLENIHDGWARISGGESRSPQVTVFANASTTASVEAELAALVTRLTDKVKAVRKDPETFAAKYAETLGFPAPVVAAAIKNTLFDTPAADTARKIIVSYTAVMNQPAPGADFYADF